LLGVSDCVAECPQCVYLPTPIQSPATRSAPQSTLARDWPAAGCMRSDVRHRG
jgi:hypothetical protein